MPEIDPTTDATERPPGRVWRGGLAWLLVSAGLVGFAVYGTIALPGRALLVFPWFMAAAIGGYCAWYAFTWIRVDARGIERKSPGFHRFTPWEQVESAGLTTPGSEDFTRYFRVMGRGGRILHSWNTMMIAYWRELTDVIEREVGSRRESRTRGRLALERGMARRGKLRGRFFGSRSRLQRIRERVRLRRTGRARGWDWPTILLWVFLGSCLLGALILHAAHAG